MSSEQLSNLLSHFVGFPYVCRLCHHGSTIGSSSVDNIRIILEEYFLEYRGSVLPYNINESRLTPF